MKDDPKKGIALLLAGDDEEDAPASERGEGEEDDAEAMKDGAASDLLAAVKKGDAEGVKAAMQAFHDACGMEY